MVRRVRKTNDEKEEERRYMARQKLCAIAKKNHPYSNDIARWGGGATQKYRICNICDYEIEGSSFAGNYPRTKKSERAEEEHIEEHVNELLNKKRK